MPDAVSLVVRFAEGVLARDEPERGPREQIEGKLGAAVLTEVSLAVATGTVFSTLKRRLGFATSCSLAEVEVNPKS